MKKTIPLSVIVNAIEETMDGWHQFYNTATGEVDAIPSWDNDYTDPDEFRETAEKIDASDDYVELPTQQELHEYDIMERFAEKMDSAPLFRALRGRKPFRTFKDRAIQIGLEKKYYAFRSAAYADIAREWCRENEIPFIEEGKAENADGLESRNHTGWPEWCASLQTALTAMAENLGKNAHSWDSGRSVFFPEDYGCVRGEKATKAIQRAIDAAGKTGGTVRLRSGDYLTGTLVMRSHVRLEVCAGARLMASTDLLDYPEMHAQRLTVQDTSMGMHQSLIFAEGCEDIALCGAGVIDGQGSPRNFPGEETAQGTPGRPFLIRVIDCRRVHVSGLTLKNAACWMQNYLNCDSLLIEGLTVRNHANYNNDGMDIDGCRDVVIRHCRVSSGDDALCFKGASQRPLDRVLVEDCDFYSACNAVKVGTDTQGSFRNVLIRRCRIGGLAEDPSGLKHPCADSGVSLEMVDGGTLENFWLTDLYITRAWSPFFLRLEDRGRVKPGDPYPGIGTLHRVLISRVRGEANGPRGSYIMGIPEKAIEDIAFEDVELLQYAWEGVAPDARQYPDMKGVYPDAHMIDSIGPAPAYGLWTRHARNITLKDYWILPYSHETRPEFLDEGAISQEK